MRTKVVRIKFKCDRCGTQEERNVNETFGTIISFTQTHDMKYGNNTTGEFDLCQKCTNDFDTFMRKEANA